MVEPSRKKQKESASILHFFRTCENESNDEASHVRKQVEDETFIAEPQPLPQSGGFNQSLPDCCESNESPNAVNIDENPDQLESNSASANAGDECSSLPAMGPYDLGALRTSFSSGALSDLDKYKVLKQYDQPQGYRFPAVSEGGQLRRFQASWFVNYPWLAYSKSENGGYCACCMAFASSIRTGGKFGALVESPLTKFKKALETLASHEKTEYHKDSYAKMVAFLESTSKGQSVVSQLNTLHAAHIQKNRLVLKSIISAVEFCGRQGIALRGHQDDAKYLEDTDLNPGNYQALLKFRCEQMC